MKFAAVILLACVAVSQAAFTANLVQRVQPALSEALFKVRLSSRAGDEMQTTLVAQLQEHATSLLNQIQETVTTGQTIASNVVQQLQDTYAQLHALGSNVVNNGQSILSNLFGNIWGTLFGNGKSLSGIIDFVQNFNLQATINGLIAHAQNLVNELQLPQMLQNLATSLFSHLTSKGIWSSIQSAGSQAWASIQAAISNVTAIAGNAFNTAQALAQSFVNEASIEIHQITSHAATELMNFLQPYAADLGSLYTNVAAQLTGIMGN